MTTVGKFTLRLGIYGAVFVYLICDLNFCSGPLSRKLRSGDPKSAAAVAKARAQGIVAVVYGTPITLRQLDRAMAERLLMDGRRLDELTPQTREMLRFAALDDLIDHEILRMKVKVSTAEYKVTPAEVDERFRRFAALFADAGELAAALQAEGIGGESALRERLAARLQQEKYVESRIAPQTAVTEDEAREWFDRQQDRLKVPEQVELHWIFAGSTDSADAAPEALQQGLARLAAKSTDFGTLARELSDGPSALPQVRVSREWTTRERLPADLAAPVFDLPPGQPALLRGKSGWNLVEVAASQPARPRSFEEARAEITAALEAVKRREMIAAFRTELRKHENRAITIYREVLGP